MVSKVLTGYEEAFWPKKLEISHASQILTNNCQILVLSLSYLFTTVSDIGEWGSTKVNTTHDIKISLYGTTFWQSPATIRVAQKFKNQQIVPLFVVPTNRNAS